MATRSASIVELCIHTHLSLGRLPWPPGTSTASLVAAGLMPTPTLFFSFLSFEVTFSSWPNCAYSCVGDVMGGGGEVLLGEVERDACCTLHQRQPCLRYVRGKTRPSGVGMAVPGAWALATPALDIM